ncbi:MAG: SAM-dependent methyltransferase [Chitinophagales bacterium]|nr:SAM-dependent methyltransferase [Bacteroidota bacterium]MCB9042384.1 SAM-dependent methyltransferase [Chitinophagales bacterium]
MRKTGKLYLIPNLLGGDDLGVLSGDVLKIVPQLQHFIVENERNARRYLIKLSGTSGKVDSWHFAVLDKHHKKQHFDKSLLAPALKGMDIGLISEAGLPAIADPGAIVVEQAHNLSIQVIPLVGPSSIFLALAASGLNGQSFSFHGYLPIEAEARARKIKALETMSRKFNTTQIFIETPYRNLQMFESIVRTCGEHTHLCIAANLSLPDEYIFTQKIGDWRKNQADINKKPCVFLLLG